MPISDGKKISCNCIASTWEQVVVKNLLLLRLIVWEAIQVGMQVVVRFYLSLLNCSRLRHKLQEANFFRHSDTLVACKAQVLANLFQKDIHEFEHHQDELILAKIITVFEDYALSLNLSLFLQIFHALVTWSALE